jgi:hypothetical protein
MYQQKKDNIRKDASQIEARHVSNAHFTGIIPLLGNYFIVKSEK